MSEITPTADLYDKHGAGERDVVVSFGGAVFTPGSHLVSDEDGVVVLP